MQFKEAVALWRFVRRDPLGKWMGIAWCVIAWFALTWLSLSVTVLLMLLTGVMMIMQRRRADLLVEDDLDDLI